MEERGVRVANNTFSISVGSPRFKTSSSSFLPINKQAVRPGRASHRRPLRRNMCSFFPPSSNMAVYVEASETLNKKPGVYF